MTASHLTDFQTLTFDDTVIGTFTVFLKAAYCSMLEEMRYIFHLLVNVKSDRVPFLINHYRCACVEIECMKPKAIDGFLASTPEERKEMARLGSDLLVTEIAAWVQNAYMRDYIYIR